MRRRQRLPPAPPPTPDGMVWAFNERTRKMDLVPAKLWQEWAQGRLMEGGYRYWRYDPSYWWAEPENGPQKVGAFTTSLKLGRKS